MEIVKNKNNPFTNSGLKRYWDSAKENEDITVFNLGLGDWKFHFSYRKDLKQFNVHNFPESAKLKYLTSYIILSNQYVDERMRDALTEAKKLGFCKYFTIKQHIYPMLKVEIMVVTSLSVVFTASHSKPSELDTAKS